MKVKIVKGRKLEEVGEGGKNFEELEGLEGCFEVVGREGYLVSFSWGIGFFFNWYFL